MSNSLQPHGLQHARLCPSPFRRVYSISFHWVGDAIHLFHPLSSPSPPALNLSQHQGLFQWVSSSSQLFISGGILGQGKHILSNLLNIAYILAQERNHPTYKRMPPGRVIFFFFPKDGKILSFLQTPTYIIDFQSSAPQSMEDKILAMNVFRTDVVSCLLWISLSKVWFWIVMLLEESCQSASAAIYNT